MRQSAKEQEFDEIQVDEIEPIAMADDQQDGPLRLINDKQQILEGTGTFNFNFEADDVLPVPDFGGMNGSGTEK